jgi:hypothetical protein
LQIISEQRVLSSSMERKELTAINTRKRIPPVPETCAQRFLVFYASLLR